ncbi:hypothetical protein GCD22_00948 [Acidithiobacillus thiooxidans ATCC 19377]|uniref:Uncharacterized protein n=1 Tax=Acidithiobacillus thiooxidans ATCC 19377 TaxID=637390 RepID=A0A5P9XN10_ACITH|nr:hypothetical protein GCD22_00948 [Acidithiobacillus thiooxidans ATCC 19377]
MELSPIVPLIAGLDAKQRETLSVGASVKNQQQLTISLRFYLTGLLKNLLPSGAIL